MTEYRHEECDRYTRCPSIPTAPPQEVESGAPSPELRGLGVTIGPVLPTRMCLGASYGTLAILASCSHGENSAG